MAACTKVAAFGALLRVFYVALGGLAWDWRPILWAVAILTMVVGSVVALTQTDVKRMLAYSLDRARRLHPHRAGRHRHDRRHDRRGARRLERAVLPARLRLHRRSARSPS